LGEWLTSKTLLDDALSFARECQDRHAIVKVLDQQGYVLLGLGEFEAVHSVLEESLAIARESGDAGLLFCEVILGWLALREERPDEARRLFERVVATARQANPPDRVSLIRGLAGLGDVAREEKDHGTAIQLYRDCLGAARLTGATNLVVMGLGRIAGLAVVEGYRQRATRLFGVLETYYARAGSLKPWEPHPEHEQDLAAVQSLCSEEAFARAWAEGQVMTLEQAVGYALRDEAPA
jgi:tetratricopeptide (TPR) repeat protein